MKIFGFKVYYEKIEEEEEAFEEVIDYGIVVASDYSDAVSKIISEYSENEVNRVEIDFLKGGSLFSCGNEEDYGKLVDMVLF